MLHRCDGAVVCDIVSHVVGERLDLGHSVAHGHGRLDSGEHTQIVAGIAKAKGARVAGRDPGIPALAPRPRPCRCPWGSARDSGHRCCTASNSRSIKPSSLATRAKLGTLRHTLPTRRLPSTRISSALCTTEVPIRDDCSTPAGSRAKVATLVSKKASIPAAAIRRASSSITSSSKQSSCTTRPSTSSVAPAMATTPAGFSARRPSAISHKGRPVQINAW